VNILISESSQVVAIGTISAIPAGPTSTVSSPWLRPRLEGYGNALRGKAFDAKFADTARVLFTIRQNAFAIANGDVLNNFQFLLSLQQAPLLGNDPEVAFPSVVTDVSGFAVIDGRIVVDVALNGVSRVTLQIIRRTDPTVLPTAANQNLFVLCQVLAAERAVDVETVLHDKGEA
jgi:hypothetical protein